MAISDSSTPALRYGSGRSSLEKPNRWLFVRYANRSSPRAGRANDQHMADIANMDGKPERRRAGGFRIEQRRGVEMIIAHRPGPHRRKRHQMGEVQRMH